VQRVVAAGSVAAADPSDVQVAQDAISALQAKSLEIDSVVLIEPKNAEFLLASDKSSLGTKQPQRDYVQAALKGEQFVTGVTISTITNKPSIFHSEPVKDAQEMASVAVNLRELVARFQLTSDPKSLGDWRAKRAA
jgi:C4-dicarboxylate-specific signal transduction histidine kinase